MSDGLSNCPLSSRVLQRAKDREGKRVYERRRNLVYLVADFLRENGYDNSYEMFTKEARIAGDIVVCDNIDLDTILLDYSDYYHIKFNKQPKICKRIDANMLVASASMPNLGKRDRITRPRKPEENNNLVKAKSPMADENENSTFLKIISVSTSSHDNCSNKTTGCIRTPNNENIIQPDDKFMRSLGDLYPPGSELRDIADIISGEIVMTNLNVRWDDIKGLDDCKIQLKEAAVYPIKYPCLFDGKLRPWQGILLYGPPGTGKTMLAKAVASESNATFFNITSSCIVSKWRGESEKYVRVLCDIAKYCAPSIIFIDEIDWTATGSENTSTVKSEPSRRFRAEFLARIDGLLSTESSNVLLLAATNLPWDLDAALLRRLEKRILVDLPNETSRREILSSYIQTDLLNDPEFDVILKNTDGYSCSDIKLLCKEAWMMQLRPIWKDLESNRLNPSEVSTKNNINQINHLSKAMKTIKPPIGKRIAEKYKKWQENVSV